MSTEKGTAILCLVLNMIVIPGIGSFLGNKKKTGLSQIGISIISFPLMYFYIGLILFPIVWIWGVITGIQILKEADR